MMNTASLEPRFVAAHSAVSREPDMDTLMRKARLASNGHVVDGRAGSMAPAGANDSRALGAYVVDCDAGFLPARLADTYIALKKAGKL